MLLKLFISFSLFLTNIIYSFSFFQDFWLDSNSSVEIGISDFIPTRNPNLTKEENDKIGILQSSLYRKDEIPFPYIASGLKLEFLKTKKKLSIGFGYEYQNDYHQFSLPQKKDISLSGIFLNHLFYVKSLLHLKDQNFFFTPFIGLDLGLITYSSLLIESIGKPIENIDNYQKAKLENFSLGVFTGLSMGIKINLIKNILSLRYSILYQITTPSAPFKAREYDLLGRETFANLFEEELFLSHSGLKMNLALIFYPNF